MAARPRPLPTQQTSLSPTRTGLTGAPTQGGLPQAGPGQVQYGNQPGVPTASGTMHTTFDPATGQTTVNNGTAPGAGVPPPATTTGWGQWTPEGFDPTKIGSGHSSPKYMIGQALSNFDYTQGITPEVIAALQALGLGDVEQLSKDKIRFTGNVDPRFEGYTTLDLLRGANGPGGPQGWQYGAINPNLPPDDGSGFSAPPLGPQQPIPVSGGNSLRQPSQPQSGPPVPGWVQLASGDWVPPDHPLASGPLMQSQSSGGGTSSGGGSRPLMGDEIRAKVTDLLDLGGAFNQRSLDMRSETLREELERTRNVETQTLDALLADRGLTGGGADIQARQNQGERLNAQHATQLRELVSQESQLANDRMMQALVTGAGMTIQDAQQAVDWFNAQTNRQIGQGNVDNAANRNRIDELLGMGNLGLGQAQLASSHALGQGRLGLDSTLGMSSLQNDWLRIMAQILGTQAGQTPNY